MWSNSEKNSPKLENIWPSIRKSYGCSNSEKSRRRSKSSYLIQKISPESKNVYPAFEKSHQRLTNACLSQQEKSARLLKDKFGPTPNNLVGDKNNLMLNPENLASFRKISRTLKALTRLSKIQLESAKIGLLLKIFTGPGKKSPGSEKSPWNQNIFSRPRKNQPDSGKSRRRYKNFYPIQKITPELKHINPDSEKSRQRLTTSCSNKKKTEKRPKRHFGVTEHSRALAGPKKMAKTMDSKTPGLFLYPSPGLVEFKSHRTRI